MPLILFLIFVVIPLAEIAVFIAIGELIGILPTIAIVIVTAFIGTILLRMQGVSVLQRAQLALHEGRIPVDSVVDGVCLLVAGAFLLTPGIITDSIGFLLFIPQFRHWLAQIIFRQIVKLGKVKFSKFDYNFQEQENPGWGQNEESGPIIDIEPNEVSSDSAAGKTETRDLDTARPLDTTQKRDNRRKSPWNKSSK